LRGKPIPTFAPDEGSLHSATGPDAVAVGSVGAVVVVVVGVVVVLDGAVELLPHAATDSAAPNTIAFRTW
jgi:hypothetical protein